MEKLKAESLSFCGEHVAEKAAHAWALMNYTRLRRDIKKTVKQKEGVARLFAAEKTKQGNSAVVEPLKKDVSAITMKAGGQVGDLAAS